VIDRDRAKAAGRVREEPVHTNEFADVQRLPPSV